MEGSADIAVGIHSVLASQTPNTSEGLSKPAPIVSTQFVDQTEQAKDIRDLMDKIDGGCIITNIHRHSDRLAHWISASPDRAMETVSKECFPALMVF